MTTAAQTPTTVQESRPKPDGFFCKVAENTLNPISQIGRTLRENLGCGAARGTKRRKHVARAGSEESKGADCDDANRDPTPRLPL
jgi:hypothetical protein